MRKVYEFKRSDEDQVVMTTIEDGTNESHDPFYTEIANKLYDAISNRLVSAVPNDPSEFESCWYGSIENLFERVIDRYKESITNEDGSWDRRIQQSVIIINSEDVLETDGSVRTKSVEIAKFDMDEIISFREHDTNYQPIFDKVAYFKTEVIDDQVHSKVFYKNKTTSKYWTNQFLALKIENQTQIDTLNFFREIENLHISEQTRIYYYIKSRSDNSKTTCVNVHEVNEYLIQEEINLEIQGDCLEYAINLIELAKCIYPVNTDIKTEAIKIKTNVLSSEMEIYDDGDERYLKIPIDLNTRRQLETDYEIIVSDDEV